LVSCGGKNEEISLTPIPMSAKTMVKFSEPEKLVDYVNDEQNGFVKVKTIENIKYYSVLKPVEYLLAQKRLKDNNVKLKSEEFEDLQYFDLRIEIEDFKSEFIKYDLDSPASYEQRVKYCAFEMQNDIKLIDGNDTLRCVLYHFERAYDVVPYGHFILGFETTKKKNIEAKTLCFDDKLFNKGMIKFTYPPKTIAKQPVLL
jgi:hypothetical protein